MERLGVFVFFDPCGVMDLSYEILLREFSLQCQKIIAVVNGTIQKESLERLEIYAEYILCRENVGFDAGAYKDIFLEYILKDQEKRFDEVVLINGTFYGALYPLGEIFMNFHDQEVDFWGITRHPEGKWEDGNKIPTHIQSYYIVVRKKMLYSKSFHRFWKTMNYPATIREAIEEFEIKFTVYFTERGFTGKALTDLSAVGPLSEKEKNPYLFNNYQMIKDLRVPFLKRNSLSLTNAGYIDALHALEYVERKLDYNVGLIWENIFRLSKEDAFSVNINYWKLEEFYNCHNRVFIFGKGVYGRNIAEYFLYRGWINSGFIVSANQFSADKDVKKFSELSFEKKDGIILALNKKNFSEVFPEIEGKVEASQLMVMHYTF